MPGRQKLQRTGPGSDYLTKLSSTDCQCVPDGWIGTSDRRPDRFVHLASRMSIAVADARAVVIPAHLLLALLLSVAHEYRFIFFTPHLSALLIVFVPHEA